MSVNSFLSSSIIKIQLPEIDEGGGGGGTRGITNPVLPWIGIKTGEQVLANTISALIALSLTVAGLISFAYLIFGGIQWITSGGDKAGLEAARNRIIHAIIGLIIVASTWALMILVLNNFLGVCFPNIDLPTLGQTTPGRKCGTPNPQPPGGGGSSGGGGSQPTPTDQTWYGCAQDKIIIVGQDPNCVNGHKAYTYTCQPNGCTARNTGSCQIQNRGNGQCPSTCQWQATKPC